MQNATLLQFPTIDFKIKRLDELKARYLVLADEEEDLVQEAFRITGEEEGNGHTFNFMANDPEITAAEMFAEMERNPSDQWDLDLG